MNSTSSKFPFRQVRRLLVELTELFTAAMPDAVPKKVSVQAIQKKKDSDLPALLDDSLKELSTARRRLERYMQLTLLRAEMWKAAAEERFSEERLIETLFKLVGPALDLSGCGYYAIPGKRAEATCTIQWHKDAAPVVTLSKMPYEIIQEFIGKKYVAVSGDARAEAGPSKAALLLAANNGKSFCAVPFDTPSLPRGIFIFSDCLSSRQWTQTEIAVFIEVASIAAVKSASIKAERSIMETNASLELQIKERTAELAAANRRLLEDIGEREKIQGTLAAEKALLASTLHSIGDAVITIDAKGRVVFFNKAAEELTGWSFGEVAGKGADTVIQAFGEHESSEPYIDFIGRCLTERKADRKSENRCRVRSRGGEEHIVAYEGTSIKEGGEYRGAVLVLRNITQSYFLEEEVLKTKRLESVGVLAGGIAHDFNNLLTGITTYLFMARMSVAGNKEASMLINEAEKASFKASSLTKQLLSFSKGGPSVKEYASVKQLVQDTVGFCLSGSNVDYRLDLPDDLLPVEVDKGQIDQALNNLILNALQAMPDGGIVTIQARNCLFDDDTSGTIPVSPKTMPLQAGKYVQVTIKDEGIGIPKGHIGRIFDPYFTTKRDGTGLGLTITYSIIKKHGGHIFVESEQGKGSAFTFLLPASSERNGKGSKRESFFAMGKGKVLIMDDDMIVRTVVETLLKKTGYTPVCVPNGDLALAAYTEAMAAGEPFKITIMDLTIPGGMGGKATVRKLREIDPQAYVIVFSGYSNDPILANFKEHGFDGVLSKPFSIDEFMRTISSVPSRSSSFLAEDAGSVPPARTE